MILLFKDAALKIAVGYNKEFLKGVSQIPGNHFLESIPALVAPGSAPNPQGCVESWI